MEGFFLSAAGSSYMSPKLINVAESMLCTSVLSKQLFSRYFRLQGNEKEYEYDNSFYHKLPETLSLDREV